MNTLTLSRAKELADAKRSREHRELFAAILANHARLTAGHRTDEPCTRCRGTGLHYLSGFNGTKCGVCLGSGKRFVPTNTEESR